jgi:hypothetical protein
MPDYARVILFLEESEVDLNALSMLAVRFGLSEQLTRALNGAKGGAR